MNFNHYLGIDISKQTLDAALIIKEGEIVGQTKVTNNQPEGILFWTSDRGGGVCGQQQLFGKAGKYDFTDVGFGVGIGCRESVMVK